METDVGISIFALAISFFALLATTISVFVAYKQVLEARKSYDAQNLLALIEHLQRDDVRQARALVLSELKNKKFIEWTPVQKNQASLVPASYDVAGILIRSGLLKETAIIENYGPSIIRCYEICLPLVQEYRQEQSEGLRYKYWDDFEWLYERAKAVISIPDVDAI